MVDALHRATVDLKSGDFTKSFKQALAQLANALRFFCLQVTRQGKRRAHTDNLMSGQRS
ncbi:hypothetical protein D3C86_2205250 [compost metagenome]